MLNKHTKNIILVVLFLGGMNQSNATTILPTPDCGVVGNCLTFADFSVFSLAFLNVTNGYGSPTSGDPFYVRSQPGDIKDGVVFGTGASGTPIVHNFSGMDNAYDVPSAGSTTEVSFSTTLVSDPGTLGDLTPNPFASWDQLNTWDADIGALRTFLNDGGGVFAPYFNLNETGTEGLEGIDLQIWVHMWVDNASGDAEHFYLTGGPLEFGAGAPIRDPNGPNMTLIDDTDPQWSYVHGTICVNLATDTVLSLGSCTSSEIGAGGSNVNQNLGADNAAFAIFNQELNDIILGSAQTQVEYTNFHMDWRMIHENNGFEQAFLLADTQMPVEPPSSVPEATSFALLGLGLLGLGLRQKRLLMHKL